MLTTDTFTGNSAADGGGFANDDGTATLTADTFTGNSVGLSGGGIYVFGGTVKITGDTLTGNSGSGIYDQDDFINNVAAKVTLVNDTLTGNSDSGIFNVSAHLTLTNCTITGNTSTSGGSGIYNDDEVPPLLYNTIVAGNYIAGASYSTMPSEIYGTVSGSYNLIGDPSSRGGLPNGANGNIVGIGGVSPIPLSTIFALDPNGDPLLASYGGPTQTVALVPGSPAIDAGERDCAQLPARRPARPRTRRRARHRRLREPGIPADDFRRQRADGPGRSGVRQPIDGDRHGQ